MVSEGGDGGATPRAARADPHALAGRDVELEHAGTLANPPATFTCADVGKTQPYGTTMVTGCAGAGVCAENSQLETGQPSTANGPTWIATVP